MKQQQTESKTLNQDLSLQYKNHKQLGELSDEQLSSVVGGRQKGSPIINSLTEAEHTFDDIRSFNTAKEDLLRYGQ